VPASPSGDCDFRSCGDAAASETAIKIPARKAAIAAATFVVPIANPRSYYFFDEYKNHTPMMARRQTVHIPEQDGVPKTANLPLPCRILLTRLRYEAPGAGEQRTPTRYIFINNLPACPFQNFT
jgi:hypothetical protein